LQEKHAVQPLVVEVCWPTKKARHNGCTKNRNGDETVRNEPAVDVACSANWSSFRCCVVD
jgi:hypothetical protein